MKTGKIWLLVSWGFSMSVITSVIVKGIYLFWGSNFSIVCSILLAVMILGFIFVFLNYPGLVRQAGTSEDVFDLYFTTFAIFFLIGLGLALLEKFLR